MLNYFHISLYTNMKIILILYFFILFILLVPGLLLKQSSLLHSLLFALLLYFTFPIIDKSIHENFKQNDVNVSFSNTISSAPQGNSLGNLLVSAFEELSEMQVNIAHGKKILAAANGGEEEINELKELIDDIMKADEFEGEAELLMSSKVFYLNFKDLLVMLWCSQAS